MYLCACLHIRGYPLSCACALTAAEPTAVWLSVGRQELMFFFHLNWTAVALHISSLLKQFRESLFVAEAKICSEIISCQLGVALGLQYWEGSASSDLFKTMNLSSFLGTKFSKRFHGDVMLDEFNRECSTVLRRGYWQDSSLRAVPPVFSWKPWLNFLSLVAYVWDHWPSKTKICWSRTVFRDGSPVSSFNLRRAELLAKIREWLTLWWVCPCP